MSHIDIDVFERIFEGTNCKFVKASVLNEAIRRVNTEWSWKKQQGLKVNLHACCGLTLCDMKINTLFEAEAYRKALCMYYRERAKKKKGRLIIQKNAVEKASKNTVIIRTTPNISSKFVATKRIGKLLRSDIVHAYNILHKSDHTNVLEGTNVARIQALAIMNNKRGF